MVRAQVLAGDIVLCSWARHFTQTHDASLSTQVYKWANLMLGVALRWTCIPSRGEEKYSYSCSCYMLRKPEISAGLMGLLARKQRRLQYFSGPSWIASWTLVWKAILSLDQASVRPTFIHVHEVFTVPSTKCRFHWISNSNNALIFIFGARTAFNNTVTV